MIHFNMARTVVMWVSLNLAFIREFIDPLLHTPSVQ